MQLVVQLSTSTSVAHLTNDRFMCYFLSKPSQLHQKAIFSVTSRDPQANTCVQQNACRQPWRAGTRPHPAQDHRVGSSWLEGTSGHHPTQPLARRKAPSAAGALYFAPGLCVATALWAAPCGTGARPSQRARPMAFPAGRGPGAASERNPSTGTAPSAIAAPAAPLGRLWGRAAAAPAPR